MELHTVLRMILCMLTARGIEHVLQVWKYPLTLDVGPNADSIAKCTFFMQKKISDIQRNSYKFPKFPSFKNLGDHDDKILSLSLSLCFLSLSVWLSFSILSIFLFFFFSLYLLCCLTFFFASFNHVACQRQALLRAKSGSRSKGWMLNHNELC